MDSIRLKIKELVTYYCGCHGNLITIATRYMADACCSKESPLPNMDSIQLKTKELLAHNISQLDDYDVPFCEQQNTHGSCYIFLFKFKSFDQFNPPELPQILDIYSVVVLLLL